MTIKQPLYIFTFFFLIQISNSRAQTNIGLDFGSTFNKLNFTSQNNNLKITSKQGYIINLEIDRRLNNYLSIEVSPGILQKNYSIKNTKDIYQDTENTYLHLPIGIKIAAKLINRLNISGSIGGYYGYWIKSSIHGLAPNAFEISSNTTGEELIKIENIKSGYDFTKKDNRSELGWKANIGMSYKIMSDISCSINGHYYRSLTDQQQRITERQIPRYNETFAATIGISYLL